MVSLIYILLLEKLRRPAQFTLNIIQIDELYGTLTEGQGRTSFLYFRNIEIWFVSFMNRFNVYIEMASFLLIQCAQVVVRCYTTSSKI